MLVRLKDYYNDALDGNLVLTKFLDLQEISEIKSLNKDGLKVYLNGGYIEAERVRAVIQYAYYEEPSQDDFNISIYHATYNPEFTTIGHRNILGSIMSLGIERNTIGDIYISGNNIYIFASTEIEKFLIQHMPSINHQNLEFKKVDKIDEVHEQKEEIINVNVASLRLDAVIARTLNISRTKAIEMIEAGLVFINHQEIKSVDKKCNLNEIISIRKYGRIRILELLKTTKKDRLLIKVGVKH